MREEQHVSEPGVGAQGTEVRVGVGGDGGDVRVEIPEVLPVLPLKNTVLFPYLLSPLLVNTTRSKRLIDHVLVTPERLLIAPAVRRAVEGSPGADDVFSVATVLRIVKMLKFPDDSYRLLVQGVARARVEEFVATEPFLSARVQRLEEVGDRDSVEITALQRNVAQSFAAFVSESPKLSDELQVLASNLDDPGRLA
ncbi:MAG: lon, partial [Deltaproteobacteria bacterium]|nr:lon [Deltaproteobacteria bacterium]